MIGTILSDILLVLGCCLVSVASVGGHILQFNRTVVDTLSSLMINAVMILILPTALHSMFASQTSEITDKVVTFSRGTALALLLLFLGYIYFQMNSGTYLLGWEAPQQSDATDENDSPETAYAPQLTQKRGLYLVIAGFIASSLGMICCTYFLVNSIRRTAITTNVSTSFIATILVPFASHFAEGAVVIAVSRRGKSDFAISVIINNVLQISLFVIPFLVVLGWIIQQPMTLNFGIFHMMILFISVLTVNHLLQNGNYTYIHGIVLVGLYAIVATASCFC